MSVFLDLSGVSSVGFINLLTISGDDGGLGETDVPGDTSIMQVTYAETAGQPATADRLNQLVNNNFPAPVATTQDIIVTPLNGGNDPHSGQDITGNGLTFIDNSGPSPVIRVVYDVSQCCGAGMAAFDTGGNRIASPNPVILYHELSHAFRGVTGTQQANDEIPAETDENVLRGELGLCLRDVNNHNGDCAGGNDCGGSAGDAGGGPPSGGCGSSVNGGCFIVTATTGSPQSTEVVRLRQLRDRVGAASKLGAQLVDMIYGEYFQFSPGIAGRLQHDVVAREVVLQIVVRPLLAWYTLAGALALEQSDQRSVKRATQTLHAACPPYLGPPMVAILEAIRAGEPLPPGAPRLLQEFAPQLREAAKLRYASWAILDPLVRAWTLASGGDGSYATWDTSGAGDGTRHRRDAQSVSEIAEQIGEWLASAPLEEVIDVPKDHKQLDKELGVLADFLSFEPQARKDLGWRLSMAWPHAAGLLKRHGFI